MKAMEESFEELQKKYGIKPDVLDTDEIGELVKPLKGRPGLTRWLMRRLCVDKVNWLHRHNYRTPGAPFAAGLLKDLDITLRIDNEQVLDSLPQGAFVTISNHPFGALDGIALIHMIASRRPAFKVIVNMVLNHITAMRPNFIAVDQQASDDPARKAVSMQGIKEAIMQVRRGEPIGMFPAGAMSKIDYGKGYLIDREWQPAMIRLIRQLKVPVIPIYFHGRNSFIFDLLGRTLWQLRTVRLPSEVFRKAHTTIHVTVGDPISVEEQSRHQESVEAFGDFLREKTYALRTWK